MIFSLKFQQWWENSKITNGNLIVKGGEKKLQLKLMPKKLGILNLSWLLSNVSFENLLNLKQEKTNKRPNDTNGLLGNDEPKLPHYEVKKLKLPHWSNRFQSTQNLDSKSKIKKWTIFGDFWRCISGYFKKKKTEIINSFSTLPLGDHHFGSNENSYKEHYLVPTSPHIIGRILNFWTPLSCVSPNAGSSSCAWSPAFTTLE